MVTTLGKDNRFTGPYFIPELKVGSILVELRATQVAAPTMLTEDIL